MNISITHNGTAVEAAAAYDGRMVELIWRVPDTGRTAHVLVPEAELERLRSPQAGSTTPSTHAADVG